MFELGLFLATIFMLLVACFAGVIGTLAVAERAANRHTRMRSRPRATAAAAGDGIAAEAELGIRRLENHLAAVGRNRGR